MISDYKGYNIVCDNTYGMYLIEQVGRGSISAVLRGSYTTPTLAKMAIDKHEKLSVKKKG